MSLSQKFFYKKIKQKKAVRRINEVHPLSQTDVTPLINAPLSKLAIVGGDDVIQYNSTFVEFVGPDYNPRGDLTLMAAFAAIAGCSILGVCLYFFKAYLMPASFFSFDLGDWSQFLFIICTLLVGGWLLKVSYTILKQLFFNLTHWPIIFNRKTRMLHAFRYDGTVTSIPWDEVSFGYRKTERRWCVYAYVLADDQQTIIDEIHLFVGTVERQALSKWAFVQAYMEFGMVEAIADTVTLCLPITDKKETLAFGFQLHIQPGDLWGWLIYPLAIPMALLEMFPRYLAIHSCRIPQWPAEIEASCQIAKNDPYQKTDKDNSDKMWRYMMGILPRPEYAAMAARINAANQKIGDKILAQAPQKTT